MRDFDSHSPMFKNRHSSDERRTRMFADYPHIWGRFPKLILGWMALMHYWSGYHMYQKHSLSMHLQEETRQKSRTSLPFVQAMEDIRFCAGQERNYMIMRAVSDHSDPEMFELYRSRYNQEDHFVSYYRGSTMKNHYDGRYGSGRFFTNKSNRLPEDEKNLVSAHEVSTYG